MKEIVGDTGYPARVRARVLRAAKKACSRTGRSRPGGLRTTRKGQKECPQGGRPKGDKGEKLPSHVTGSGAKSGNFWSGRPGRRTS